jgi:phosphoglycerate kinase
LSKLGIIQINKGDIFINDAFGTCHRPHSSIVGINLDKRVAGYLLKKEINYFSKVLVNPKKPFLCNNSNL